MDKEYCYENTDVLINKLGIRNNEQLHVAERKLSSARIFEIENEPVKGAFDLKHLQSIHKAIFSDIYSWAGKIRKVDIAKSNLFCRAQFIDSYSKEIFGRLRQDKYLIGMDKKLAIGKLAEYMGDINALHPFREGNGRTQRQFITYLAKATGINLDLSKTDADKMMSASLKSFNTDYTGFEQIFNEIAMPMLIEDQERFLKEISKDAYKEFKALKQQERLPNRDLEFSDSALETSNAREEHATMSMNGWRNAVKKPNNSTRATNVEKKPYNSMDEWKKQINDMRSKEKPSNDSIKQSILHNKRER